MLCFGDLFLPCSSGPISNQDRKNVKKGYSDLTKTAKSYQSNSTKIMKTVIDYKKRFRKGLFSPFMKRFALLFVFALLSSVTFARPQKDSVVSETPKPVEEVKVQATEEVKTQPTEDVITQPEFKGGIEKMYQYISDNFEYPEDAAKRSVNGKMDVEFTIEKSGDVTYVGILKGLDYSIDGEVLRLLKAMPRWIPATKNGVPVRYKVSMPITIRASRNKNQKSSISLKDYRDQ